MAFSSTWSVSLVLWEPQFLSAQPTVSLKANPTCAHAYNSIVYDLNFFGGFIISAGIYYLLCWISPIPATSDVWREIDDDASGRNNTLVYGMGENEYSENGSEEDMQDVKVANNLGMRDVPLKRLGHRL